MATPTTTEALILGQKALADLWSRHAAGLGSRKEAVAISRNESVEDVSQAAGDEFTQARHAAVATAQRAPDPENSFRLLADLFLGSLVVSHEDQALEALGWLGVASVAQEDLAGRVALEGRQPNRPLGVQVEDRLDRAIAETAFAVVEEDRSGIWRRLDHASIIPVAARQPTLRSAP